MPSSKRSFNWTSVGFTPSGGTLSTATGVTRVEIDPQGNLVVFSGDNDRYPTTVVNDFSDPQVTITTADQAWVRAIPPGTRGAVTATHNDAKAGVAVGSGAITYTISGAIAQNNPTGGSHRQFGEGRIIFRTESADGQTNPIATTAA